MKKKFLACGLAACAALVALALPTKKEVQAARPIVAELMADAVAEQKAGKIKTAELGARALALADRAETEAARLLLLQGAVIAFARGGEPARAAEAVRKMRGEIKGITPEYEADMLSRAVKSLPLKDGRLLYGMLDDARRLVRYRREAATLEKSLAAKDDPAKRAQLAERLAALGEWKRALEEIAKLGGDVARAAKFELGEGTMTSAEVAEIWWRQSGMKDADGFTVFQRHAGEWYAKALADGSLTGLKRDLAQKRIDDMGGIKNFRGSGTVASKSRTSSNSPKEKLPKETSARPKPLVLDLGGGVKMEMVGCPAGAFMMGYDASKPEYTPHEVTITRPFWMGRFPVTVEQWVRVMQPIAMLKQKIVNAEAVFDALGGQKLPQIYCKPVDVDEFITLVNKKFANHLPKGYVFRLATWAEWEYAGRANGTPGRDWFALPWGMKGQERHIVSVQDRINALEAKSVRYREEDISSGAESLPFRVGTKSANQWGLEDMWGNVNELLMDRLSPRVPLPSWGIATIPSEFLDWNGKNRDPLFWDSSANANGSVMQATRWGWGRRFAWRRDKGGRMGFRLCIGPDLLKERTGDTKVTVPTLSASEEKLPQETSARPMPLVLDLGGGVKMEMVGCPSGKFLRRGFALAPKCREPAFAVEITRPFWFGKYPVTIAEWNRFMPEAGTLPGVKQADMDPRVPIQCFKQGTKGLSRNTAEEFMDQLTQKFKHRLPSGYIFRWPTDAEWEYAFRANATDPSDPFDNPEVPQDRIDASFVQYDDCLKYWGERGCNPNVFRRSLQMAPYPPVGSRKPNAWGIYDMGGPTMEVMLDSFVKTENAHGADTLKIAFKANNLRDPLVWSEVDKTDTERLTCLRWGFSDSSHKFPGAASGRFSVKYSLPPYFPMKLRLVVGPDLLKERGITPPKLDK